MQLLLYFNFFFAFLLLLFGFLYKRKYDKNIFFYVGILLSIIVVGAVMLFTIENVNRKRGMEPYNMTGLTTVFAIALVVALFSGSSFFTSKRFYPSGLLFLLCMLELITLALLWVYYHV